MLEVEKELGLVRNSDFFFFLALVFDVNRSYLMALFHVSMLVVCSRSCSCAQFSAHE